MKKILLGALALFSMNAFGQNVTIPDANFKTYLLGNTSINTDPANPTEITVAEAQAYTGIIDADNLNITDLTGIAAFVSVTHINCSYNQLTSLDVSSNVALTRLYCNNNQLTSLDVSANLALDELFCYTNQITSLDVSANAALTEMNCSTNQLTSLNVANGNNGTSSSNLYWVNAAVNPNLTCIQHDSGFDPTTAIQWIKDATASWSTNCGSSSCTNIVNIPDANFKNALINHSPTIDTDGDGEICQTEAQAYTGAMNIGSKSISDLTGIEAFVNLTELYCNGNQLTSVDVSANTALTTLNCIINQLTSLDVSNNTALTFLDCYSNQLTSLDVSNNTALTYLDCYNNQLSSLDVANGNNGASSSNLYYMRADGNPNLTCIQHDAGGFTPPAWTGAPSYTGWQKDATASWSTNCSGSTCANIVNIPDANFKAALLDHGVGITSGASLIDTDGDGEICETEALAYTGIINVTGQNISDLTGIEAFLNVTILDCSNNQLTNVDISVNTALEVFYCQTNQLTNLSVSVNTALTNLHCAYNQLSSLDVSSNTALEQFNCRNNQIASLDVSNNTALIQIDCQQNQINSIDISASSSLKTINCNTNQLTSLNVANGNNGSSGSDLSFVNATNNPNLSCIQHDTGFDPSSVATWTKDVTAQWSDNCSLNINENNISFSIVPNPTSGMVTIDTDVEISSVEIFSTSGQKVASFETKAFDISALQSGVYFVKALSDSGSFTTRIIRE